jgi:hypothetical protein
MTTSDLPILSPVQKAILWVARDGHSVALKGRLRKPAERLAKRGYLIYEGKAGDLTYWRVTDEGSVVGGIVADEIRRKIQKSAEIPTAVVSTSENADKRPKHCLICADIYRTCAKVCRSFADWLFRHMPRS